MESNPYAAPAAVVDDVRGHAAKDMESRKAGRGRRLGAAVLDGLVNVVWLAPFFWGAMMGVGVKQGLKPAAPMVGLLLLGVALLVAMIVVNCLLIHRYGQTIGKRTLDIAIVRTDGERLGLARYIFLRVLPVGLLGVIPLVGKLAGLVDVLLIFGAERRCLHDLIADTIVIDV
jgi:uncharacterized RDD family membrane protein YckC